MTSARGSSPSSPWPETVKPGTSGRLDPTKWYCEHCAKTSYESEMRGWQAIGVILRRSDSPVVPCRVYACPEGEGWHLTSQWEEPKP